MCRIGLYLSQAQTGINYRIDTTVDIPQLLLYLCTG